MNRGFPAARDMARVALNRYDAELSDTGRDYLCTLRTLELALVQLAFEYQMTGALHQAEFKTGPRVMAGILDRALVFSQGSSQQALSPPSTPEQPTRSISRLIP